MPVEIGHENVVQLALGKIGRARVDVSATKFFKDQLVERYFLKNEKYED